MKEKKKIAVAMSGGVDSGVAAALLVEQGYEVVGVHLSLWKEGMEGDGGQTKGLQLPSSPSKAAKKTAEKLRIPFYVQDYAEDFKKIVVDYFLAEYAAGRTPNPCVVCNQFIKFGKLLDYARALGCQFLATGHYARIVAARPWRAREAVGDGGQTKGLQLQPSPPVYKLLKGVDESKDQSYFLWTLTQEKLVHILFPIGGLTKPKVRKIAQTQNLPVSDRQESFEICFIQDKDYRDFLKQHIPEAIKPGEVVNTKGQVIGKHFGLPLYTVGQRKGFEVQSAVPLYVVGKNLEKNQLVVGRGRESEKQKFAVGGVNWISGPSFAKATEGREGLKCEVRVRYQGPLLKAKLKVKSEKLKVILEEPVRGITPGQSAVFYVGDEVLGGGVIEG